MDLTDDKSALVQVMAWCHQATSHYLSQYWPRSMSLGHNELIIKIQWSLDLLIFIMGIFIHRKQSLYWNRALDFLCDNIWTHNTTPTFFWLTAIVRTQPMTISRVAVLNSVSLEILCMVTRMGRGPIWASAKIKWRSNELWLHPSCWNSCRSVWLCQYHACWCPGPCFNIR